MMLTPTQLIAATGCTAANAERYAEPLAKAMEITQIDSLLRMAHFISQWCHETGGFVYMTEIADGSAYEGRKDLGNTRPGDGRKFKGRGAPMLTGANNYREFGAWLKLKCGMDVDLLEHPEIVATNPLIACLAAAWYWMSRGINRFADADDCKAVSIAINGKNRDGLPNHFPERQALLIRAKRAFGL